MNKEDLIGKCIFMDDEEYEVEEILGAGIWYNIININYGDIKRVPSEFVAEKVKTYEEDLKNFENKKNDIDNNFIKTNIDSQISITENKLLQSIELLSKNLSNTVDYINSCKERGIDYSVNELGIIQNEGNTIDVLCSKLMTLKEIRKSLEGLEE